MNLKRRVKSDVSALTASNLRRLNEIFNALRGRFQDRGPYLMGDWSIADAFYTPVASRIRTYGLRLSDYGDMGAGGRYVETLLEQPHFLEWEAAALADSEAKA